MDRIDANPVHDRGQTEESLNSECLNDQELECMLTNKKHYNTKQKTVSDLRNFVRSRLDSTEK